MSVTSKMSPKFARRTEITTFDPTNPLKSETTYWREGERETPWEEQRFKQEIDSKKRGLGAGEIIYESIKHARNTTSLLFEFKSNEPEHGPYDGLELDLYYRLRHALSICRIALLGLQCKGPELEIFRRPHKPWLHVVCGHLKLRMQAHTRRVCMYYVVTILREGCLFVF